MGSLSASGVPVVAKTSLSFRKGDVRIKSTNSYTDSTSVVSSYRPENARPIGSGSIVRGNGTVNYAEERVWGVTLMGRTTTARIASDVTNSRNRIVDLDGNQTHAVIPSGLVPNLPQLGFKHTGERIQVDQSVNDNIDRRILASGLY